MSVKRLGKGLEALIRSDSNIELDNSLSTVKTSTGVSKIKIKDIRANPNQPRRLFDDEKLNELVSSIMEKGVITPITVRKIKNGYELIAGERRWRASKKANLTLIPAYVIEVKNQSDIMELALVENIQRENLNPIEESEAYEVLHKKYKMSHEAIANSVGKARASISNSLRLLQLPPSIRKSLRSGEISSGHARAILQAKTIKKMNYVWNKIKINNLSVRGAELLVRNKIPLKKNKKIPKNVDIEIINLENKLIEFLGTKVKIKPGKKGGRLEVSYFSNDELSRIFNLINKEN